MSTDWRWLTTNVNKYGKANLIWGSRWVVSKLHFEICQTIIGQSDASLCCRLFYCLQCFFFSLKEKCALFFFSFLLSLFLGFRWLRRSKQQRIVWRMCGYRLALLTHSKKDEPKLAHIHTQKEIKPTGNTFLVTSWYFVLDQTICQVGTIVSNSIVLNIAVEWYGG